MSTSVQYRAAASRNGVGGGSGGTAASGDCCDYLDKKSPVASASTKNVTSSSSAPFRRPPPQSSRVRRTAIQRKYSKPLGGAGGGISVHPDEIFHLMLLGFSLIIISAVVVYRATHEYGGSYAAVDDAVAAGSSPALRPNAGAGGGGGGWLGGLFRWGSPPPRPCPESMDHIGDKTRPYYELRQEYEALLPPDDDRTLAFVRSLRKREYESVKSPQEVGYDIHNCPLYPLPGYPAAWPVMDVLNSWPTEDTDPRQSIYQGLCVFDHDTEFEKAKNYREAEVPFILRDDPSFLRTAERWNQPGYMDRLMGPVPHRTEYSPNNHFLYWMNPKTPKKAGPLGARKKKKGPQIKEPEGWTPPTKLIRMPYAEWFGHANVSDDNLGPDNPHWYYRLIGCGEMGKCDKDSSEFLFDEIPNFQPRDGGFHIVEPAQQKGIHCRFGMKGVIAENHFDGSRNTIVLFGGERRYILSHPDQCPNLALLPKGHPSARHSAVDWTNPDLEQFPQFDNAKVNEVVMQAGDALYLPTNWFHYIVSLELNFQCNSRSGITTDYMQAIADCGFGPIAKQGGEAMGGQY